jgi:hypothetical protein
MNSPFLNAAGWDATVNKMIKLLKAPIDDADAKRSKSTSPRITVHKRAKNHHKYLKFGPVIRRGFFVIRTRLANVSIEV